VGWVGQGVVSSEFLVKYGSELGSSEFRVELRKNKKTIKTISCSELENEDGIF